MKSLVQKSCVPVEFEPWFGLKFLVWISFETEKSRHKLHDISKSEHSNPTYYFNYDTIFQKKREQENYTQSILSPSYAVQAYVFIFRNLQCYDKYWKTSYKI